MSDPREVARRVVRRALTDDAFANLALSGEIERAGLDGRDAGLATELAMGTLRRLSRLDVALAACTDRGLARTSAKLLAVLRVAAYEILFVDSVPARASVDEAAKAARRIGGARTAGFVNAVLRRLSRQGEPELPAELRARVGVEHSLPSWLVDVIAEELGSGELESAAEALAVAPGLGLRANTTRIDRDQLLEVLAEEAPRARLEAHPLAAAAVRATRLGPPERLPSFARGLFSVQDPAAQRVGELTRAGDAGSILDACAGVGGKSCHLAELTGDRVRIDAVDISMRKLGLLRESASRLGLTSIRPIRGDLLGPVSGLEATYDLVLVDAPCSGLGVLRRHPEAKWRLEAGRIADMAALQASLLDAVAGRVADGGALVYSVCTFAPVEGRAQIARFVGRHPELSLVEELATWPHRDDADGFYAARLQRV